MMLSDLPARLPVTVYVLTGEFPDEPRRSLALDLVLHVAAGTDPFLDSFDLPLNGKRALGQAGRADANTYSSFQRIADALRRELTP